jgi:hypothetical protein
MRLQALAAGALGGFAGLAASAAHAQSVPAIEPVREWNVGVRAEAYYDNNISRTAKSFVSTRTLEREDYVFTPAVTASIVQPFGRQAFFLNGDVGYVFHRNNPSLDRRRAKVTGGLGGLLGPCRPVAFGTYEAAQSDLATLDLGTSENLRETTSVALGATCARSAGVGAAVLVQRTDAKNSAPSVETSDSTTETAALSLIYSRPSLGALSVGFSYTDVEFPNRILPGRPVGDGFFSQSYFVSYERELGTKLSLGGNVGLTHLKREFAPPGVKQSFSSASYGLDLVYGLGRRIDLELHAARSITPSQQVGKTFDKRTTADASIRYEVGTRLALTAGYSWQDIESNADTASALLVVTDARVDAIFGTVTFAPNERLSLQLNVRHEEREANLPQFTYSAVRVGLSAQTSF